MIKFNKTLYTQQQQQKHQENYFSKYAFAI